jgi:hypothetical protein
MEAEKGEMCLQTKRCQGRPEPPEVNREPVMDSALGTGKL